MVFCSPLLHPTLLAIIMRPVVLIAFAIACITASSFRSGPEQMPYPTLRKSGCRIIINEINTNTQDSFSHQFIEVARYCENTNVIQRPISMDRFKLAFITHDKFLVGVCDLEGLLTPSEKVSFISLNNKRIKITKKFWFYVVGVGYPNINMELSKCQLVSSGVTTQNNVRFPVGGLYPVALMLLFNEDLATLDVIKLEKEQDIYKRTPITDILEATMMRYLQDMYIYGSSTMYQQCDYFQKYYKYDIGMENFLRDWNTGTEKDYSLSRCSSTIQSFLPLQPRLFKYAKISPGSLNLCKSSTDFRIEDFQTLRNTPAVIATANGLKCYSFTEDNANNDRYVTSDSNYRDQLDTLNIPSADDGNEQTTISTPIDDNSVDTCDPQNLELDLIEDAADFIEDEEIPAFTPIPVSSEEFEASLENEKPYIWNDCNLFSEAKKEEIRKIPLTPIDVTDVEKTDVCNWFQYLTDTKKFRCKLCNLLVNQQVIFDRPKSNTITAVMKDGVMSYHQKNKLNINRKTITDHKNSFFHKMSIQWFSLFDKNLRGSDLQAAFENDDGPFKTYIDSTKNILTLVRQSISMNLSFRNFSKLMEIVKFFGTDLGHLYENANGIRSIVESISESLHKNYIEYLKSKTPAFSLLLDGSTDISGKSIIIFLLMTNTIENGLDIKLYKIVELQGGETAENVYQALMQQLKNDKLEEFFKTNLNSVTTDGASTMYSALNNLLRDYVGRPVLRIWCYSHKTDLVYKNTVKGNINLEQVSSITNRCSKIFGNTSPKKKNILRKVTQDNGGKPFEVKRTHRIRWVNGNLRGYTGLLKNWVYIVKTLENIEKDKSMSKVSREEATNLMSYLKDPTFITHMAFLCDIGAIMADVSLSSQTLGFTLISKKEIRTQLLALIASLNGQPTPSVRDILSSVIIKTANEEVIADPTLEDFETLSGEFRGIKMNPAKPSNLGLMLFEMQETYLETLSDKTKFYFPEDIQDSYSIFSPKAFPSTRSGLETYGRREIQTINAELHWGNDDDLLNSWTKLLLSVTSHEEYSTKRLLSPEKFWEFYLDPTVPVEFDQISRDMLEKVLAISASNAQTERIFAMFAKIKTKERYSLDTAMMDHILRIKVNDLNDITNFDGMKYAKNFVLSGHARANDISRRKTWISTKAWNALVAEQDDDINDDEDDNIDYLFTDEDDTNVNSESSEVTCD